MVANKHLSALVAVAILNFTHDALRVEAHNELFLTLYFLKNIKILHNEVMKNASFFYFHIINSVFT